MDYETHTTTLNPKLEDQVAGKRAADMRWEDAQAKNQDPVAAR